MAILSAEALGAFLYVQPMQKHLLRNFLIVAGFWWTVAFLIFSFSDPSVNLMALKRIHSLFPFLIPSVPTHASALNALSLQIASLKAWSLPVLGLTVFWAILGAGLSTGWASWLRFKRKQRETAGKGDWRGVSITLGILPPLAALPRIEADLCFDEPEKAAEQAAEIAEAEGPALRTALQRLPQVNRDLIQEIIEVLAAHPEAYVGPGHQGTLLEHSVHVLEGTLLREETAEEPLLPVAAIAHDLGKIITFQKNSEGEWVRTGWHDKASARILATLPSWWRLPPDERLALDFAIRYDHSSRDMPFPKNDQIRRRALKLQGLLSQADRAATEAEKQAVLAELPLPDLAFQAFMDVLPTLPLHVAGHAPAKGVKAAGWKQGEFLFLLENQCRDRSMAMLSPEIAAALGGAFRPQHKLAPFTEHLLAGLAERQILVTEWEQQTVPADNALWNLKSGTKEFKGVLILRITDEMRLRLPETDTTYVLTVLGPLREPSLPGEMGVTSALDLRGLLRSPKKSSNSMEANTSPVKPSGGYRLNPETSETISAPAAKEPSESPPPSEPSASLPDLEPEAAQNSPAVPAPMSTGDSSTSEGPEATEALRPEPEARMESEPAVTDPLPTEPLVEATKTSTPPQSPSTTPPKKKRLKRPPAIQHADAP
jgi:predicted HD phosphohydrolase